MPTKVTAALSPASTTSTSALTLTAAAKAAIGTATITVTGKSGKITQTVTVNLTVAAGATTANATPTSLSWAKVTVGATGVAKTVTLKNTGNSTLNISRISTTGDFTSQGGGANDCLSTLAAGSSCTVTVVFQPTQTGTRTGSLIFTDDATNDPQTVTLSGTGK